MAMARANAAQRSSRRLERALSKRRRRAPRDCTVVASSASREGSQTLALAHVESDPRALARLRTKLLTAEAVAGTRTKRCYYVSETCDGAALVVAPRRDGDAVPFPSGKGHGGAAYKLPLFLSNPDGGRANVPLFEMDAATNWCIAVRRYDVDGVTVFALCRGEGSASLVRLAMSRSQVRELQRDAARLLGLRVLCEWAL